MCSKMLGLIHKNNIIIPDFTIIFITLVKKSISDKHAIHVLLIKNKYSIVLCTHFEAVQKHNIIIWYSTRSP